jgi:AraC-like DNA-binding protein
MGFTTARGIDPVSAMTATSASPPICIPEPPRFVTDDLGQCREYIMGFTHTHKFSAARRSQLQYFSHHERRIGHLSLNYTCVDCTEGFEIVKSADAPCYAFQFVLEGSCELDNGLGKHLVNPGEVFILDPGHLSREFWPAYCRQLIVRVDRTFVEQMVADEIHRELKKPLQFRPVGRDPGIVSWLHHLVTVPLQNSDAAMSSVLTNHRVVRSIERTLGMMLLVGFEHSESSDLHRPQVTVAPYYVKRAEEYIRAHARDDLTVEKIAAAAGVSPRSMFYGFRHWRNTTPMAHVRELRLELARRALEEARHGGGTVSDAAMSAGFTNFSQFSKIYKARFGETPSMTLRGS